MTSETKRLLLAFILTFGFLFVWTKYFTPKPVPKPAPVVSESTPNAPSSATVTQPTVKANPEIRANGSAQEKIEPYVIETDLARTTLTNEAGVISRVELLEYKQSLAKDASQVVVVPLEEQTLAPLTWTFQVREGASLNPIATVSDQETVYRWVDRNERQAILESDLGAKARVIKTFQLGEQPYVVLQTVKIENLSDQPLWLDAMASITAKKGNKKSKSFLAGPSPEVTAVAYVHEKEVHWKFKSIADGDVDYSQGAMDWAGFSSQYFLNTAIPTEAMWNKLSGMMVDEKTAALSMQYAQRTINPKSSIEYALKLYAGPKKMDTLETVHPTLDRSIDLGSWLGPLARLIHKLLDWIHTKIPNYGLAIIVLTILVRLAVFPLAQMQAKSVKKMTSHKPAMDALKAKYEKDREAYSRELMNYMRTHKINPASGCLPLLIQFPIFIALYRVLLNAIELRHAPFVFWINDLSSHDPFFVLPVLVGITFYFQTRLNPTPMADPAQATMMKVMPVIFSVFMIFLPSGLNLYIFVSTLWGIVQQYLVQKQLN